MYSRNSVVKVCAEIKERANFQIDYRWTQGITKRDHDNKAYGDLYGAETNKNIFIKIIRKIYGHGRVTKEDYTSPMNYKLSKTTTKDGIYS